jgi:hypothetical protein
LKDINDEEFQPDGAYYYEADGEEKGARDEAFFQSLGLCCCPSISWCSFIVIITLVEFAVFILSLCLYGGPTQSAFLAPNE